MKLQEIYNDKLEILEKVSTKDSMICTGIFAEADKPNKNGRMYPEAVLKNAVEKLQKKIEKDSAVLASAGHKKEMQVNNVSHMLQNIWFNDKNKTAQCNIKILPTESGKNTMAILKSGGSLGLSLNGLGTVTQKNGVNEVDKGFELKQVDIVLNPGFSGARFNQSNVIGESLSSENSKPIISEKEKVKKFMRKLRRLYESSLSAGMNPEITIEEFAKNHEEKVESLIEDEK